MRLNKDTVYDIITDDGKLVFLSLKGWKFYPHIGAVPVRIYTNKSNEIRYDFPGFTISTLKPGATTTISNTPIILGTDTVKIRVDLLPMNLQEGSRN